MTKAALVDFTKALAVKLGEHGITANIVVPGRVGGHLAVGHEGTPRNVAEFVRTLAWPRAGFITGLTIHDNGGIYLP